MPELSLPYAFRELRRPARHKAFHGGRGGAKSHSFAQELVLRGYERRKLRWLCCREIQRSLAASVKQLMEDKIREAGLGPREEGGNGFYRSTQTGIMGGDGGVHFMFHGLRTNPETVKSIEGLDGAWIEEADRVSQRSITILTPTLRKDDSELWWSWNRRSKDDPVDKMFLGGQPPPRSVVRRVTWEDNPYFPGVLREEMMWDKGRDRDKWLHVWEGHPVVHSEARVFKSFRVEDIDDLIPEDCVPRLGADWGFSIDPTVLVECYAFGRTLYFRREAYKVRCAIDETPALFAGTDDREPPRWANPFMHRGLEAARRGHRITADSARPETIAYLKARGFNVRGAIKGARSVEEGVEFINSFDIVVHPECVRTEAELTYYSFKTDPITEEVIPELADKDNHVIDAARYALENVRRRQRGRAAASGGQAAVPIEEADGGSRKGRRAAVYIPD